MKSEHYNNLKQKIIEMGYKSDIDWSDNIKKCKRAGVFCEEYIFVVVNSGMKAQIARKIYEKIIDALLNNKKPHDVFGHKGKCNAIWHVFINMERYFAEYNTVKDKLAYLETLPWIGGITKYHLAKNLGLNVVKPDRHLARIAKYYNKTPFELCKDIANKTGDKIVTVDTVIWRAANLRLI